MSKNDTQLDEMTSGQLRSAYLDALRGLTYDNTDKLVVGRNLAATLEATSDPVKIVKAIQGLRISCRRCCATGIFSRAWDMTETPARPVTPLGSCFRCGGSGAQDHSDGHRNRVADENYMGRAI